MPSTHRRTAAQLKVPEPPQDTVIGPKPEKKKRGRPVTKTAETTDIAAGAVQQGETRGRGRPRKDMARNDGDTTARKETAETTQRRKADEEGQEAVTTMVNYVAATTWWNAANQRDADKEILLGQEALRPNPKMHKAFPP
jgi:hypothetical protein